MKNYLLLVFILVFAVNMVPGQTLVTNAMDQPNTTGEYYSPTGITLAPGFSVLPGGSFHAFITNCAPLAASPNTDQNYITIYTPGQAFGAATDLTLLSICDVMQTVKYFDGLGRTLQTVQVKGNPDGTKDVIQPFAYDVFGREIKKYLPYSSTSNNGSYKADALTPAAGVAAFYNPAGGTNPQLPNGSPRIATPFAETSFEASMLDRPIEQGAPGDAWQLNQGHTAKIAYGTNVANEVLLFRANPVAGAEYKMNLSGLSYKPEFDFKKE